MKILAFAATSSKQSINKELVKHALDRLSSIADNVEAEVIDLNDFEMPIFSIDREAELGKPEEAQTFYDKISGVDAIIISFAEHNGSYTAAYKNIFDWATRIDQQVYQGKPMVLMATSPGARGGQTVLDAAAGSMPYFGGDVKATLAVPSYFDNFDQEAGELKGETLADELTAALTKLI